MDYWRLFDRVSGRDLTIHYPSVGLQTTSWRPPVGFVHVWFHVNEIQFRTDHFNDLFISSVCVCMALVNT